MLDFLSNPKRAASPAIAGYVYQVNVTILRWLALQNDEILELERGEDIDVIQTEIVAGTPKRTRTLEQVKNRPRSVVTLSGSDALTAIASFCEHRALNPNNTLRFRFITTAQASKEKDWVAASSGIETWEALRKGEFTPVEAESAINHLRSFLSARSKPTKLNPNTWRRFRRVVSGSNEQLSSLVQSFEWSIAAGDLVSIEGKIKNFITSWKPQLKPEEVEILYGSLFLHVFKLLTTRKQKLLKYSDLEDQYVGRLSQSDVRLLIALAELREVSTRVGAVESQLAQIEDTVRKNLQLAAAATGLNIFPGLSSSQVEYGRVAVSLEGPDLAAPFLNRPSITQQLVDGLQASQFVAVVGEPGSGKTQACALASSKLTKKPIWIHLRSAVTEERASATLDACIEAVTNVKSTLRIGDWYLTAMSALAEQRIVILDDLPRITSASVLGRRLELLSKACSANGHALVSTTYYSLPKNLANRCGASEVNVPRFSNAEVKSLLQLHGAHSEVLNDKFVDFISTITGRLPVLVAAVASFFSQTSWKADWQSFKGAITGQFAQEHREASTSIIEAMLIDAEERELLYRLTLPLGMFSREIVEELGKAPPVIKLVNEKLVRLVGTWVQQLGSELFTLSPLVDRTLANRLDKRSRLAIHARLAFEILRRKKLTPSDIITGFHHFTSGGLMNQAAILVIQALMKLNEQPAEGLEDLGVSMLWAGEPLPTEIELPLRIWLRALQIVAAEKRGREIVMLIDDFSALVSQADPQQRWGVLIGTSYLAIRFAFERPSLANRFIIESLQSALDARMPDGTEIPNLSKRQISVMLWATALHSQNDADVENWLESIEKLSSVDREALSSSDFAFDNSVVFTDGIWMREYQKPDGERDWTRVENLLRKIEETATDLNIPILAAAAMRTRIMIEAEWRHNIDGAVHTAEKALAKHCDSIAEFLLMEVTGRQLVYAERWEKGLEWMDRALANPATSKYPLLTRNLLLTIAEGFSKKSALTSLEYAEKAVNVVKTSDQRLQLAEALGEHAIALWNVERRSDSFLIWEEALKLYQESRPGGATWGKSFRLFLHASGYFGSVALLGNSPSESYVAPYQGMFLNTAALKDESVESVHDALTFMRMAMFADGVGETEKASEWAQKALAASPLGVRGALLRLYGCLATPSYILQKDYGKALEIAWTASGASSFDPNLLGVNPDLVEKHKPKSIELDTAGRSDLTLMLSMVPAFLHIMPGGLKSGAREIDQLVVVLESSANEQARTYFGEAAALMREASANAPTWQALHLRGKEYWDGGKRSLGFVCYLAASLLAPLKQSLATQISLAMQLWQFFRFSPSVKNKILGPSLEEFWRSAAETRSEEFRTASAYTQKCVADSFMHAEPVRLRRLLSSMAFCIGLDLKDEQRAWLDSDT